MNKIHVVIMLITLLVAPVRAANEELVPETIAGTVIVDAEGLLDLLGEHPEVVLIDSRVALNRKYGFIEGSVSLTDIDTTCETLAVQVPAKDHPVLFYCNGVKCRRSSNAIGIALACGYSGIYWFRNGFDEWRSKGYPFLRQE